MSQPSVDLIRGVPLFSDLDDKTAGQLASEFVERRFDEGASIATEDSGGLNFFIVLSGEASVSVHGVQVAVLGPGSDRHGDKSHDRVRPPGLELSAIRRGAPRACVEAARNPRRDAAHRRVALEPFGKWAGC